VRVHHEAFDFVCIYCTGTRRCYHLYPKRFRDTVKLSISPARNNQTKGVFFADDFLPHSMAP
jgi:hypothetical protein